LFSLPARKGGAEQVAFSPDGKTLATWDEKKILLWEIATRKIVHEFEAGKTCKFASVHFIPDGRVLAHSLDEENRGIVGVWDVRQRKELYAADNRPNTVHYATISPDGTLLATASNDTSILLWPLQAQVEEKQPLKVLPKHRGRRCNSRPGPED
jgi:WD40 repeat protein